MYKIGPNHVGVMVVNAMVGQCDQIMLMRLWLLRKCVLIIDTKCQS